MKNLSHRKLKALKNEYDREGFIKIKQLLSKHEISQIKLSLSKFIKSNIKSLSGREITFIKNSNLINSIHNLNKWSLIKKIQNTSQIKKLAKTFIGSEIKKFGAELFAKPANRGLPTPIHQDNHYWHVQKNKNNFLPDGSGITIWIALEESKKKNGAVFYFKKSHKIGLLEHTFMKKNSGLSQELKHKNLLNLLKKKTPELEIGDALVHDCMIIHGSNPNKSNQSRLGLTMRFISKKSFINKYFKKKYDSELKKIKNKN